MARIAGKVVVQPPVAGHVPSDEELLPGGQVGDAAGFCVGVGPRPGGELVDEVVASGDELLRGDLARVAEGGCVGDGGVAVPEGVDGRVDVVHGR